MLQSFKQDILSSPIAVVNSSKTKQKTGLKDYRYRRRDFVGSTWRVYTPSRRLIETGENDGVVGGGII